MKLSIKAGATSQSVNVFIRDSSSTTGGGLAAVAPAGGSLLTGSKLYYSFSGANASAGVAVSLSVLAAVNSAWSSAGIVTIDGTNMVGWVRIDIPNAALASGNGRSVSFLLFGGTNMAPTPFEIELTGWDNQSTTDGGLSKLTSLTYTVANQVDVNVVDWKGATAPAMTGDAFARLGAPAGASVSADVAAINTKTTNLPSAPAATGDAMTLTAGERNSVADALLGRNVAGGSSSGRLVKESLYVLRNKVDAANGIVYQVDDVTSAFTFSVTTAPGDPISVYDPA